MKSIAIIIVCLYGLSPFANGSKLSTTALSSINQYRILNNLPVVLWDSKLEKEASQWLGGCPTIIDAFHHMSYIAKSEFGVFLPKIVSNAITTWANAEVPSKQLSWNGTHSVGCVITSCPNFMVVFGCVYSPPYVPVYI